MEMSDGDSPIQGENLIYVDILLLVSFTIFLSLTFLGYLEMSVTQWIISPLVLAMGFGSILFSFGIRKGVVSKVPEDKGRELIQLAVATIVASAAVLLVSLL